MTKCGACERGVLTPHDVEPTESAWLIRGRDAEGRTIYYAGDGAFHHERAMAVKFQTRKAAELRSFGLADWNDVETVPA